jgi:hypothetical protein
VTKSGTNQFHGNLYELWNGALLNAADYFTNATPGNHKPGSTVNHLGGSLGGPILHNKLFFFFDSEWVRIALPIVTPPLFPVRPSAIRVAAASVGTRGCKRQCYLSGRAAGSAVLSANVLALWKTAARQPRFVGCPIAAGCANRQSVSHSSDDHEQVQTARLDYNIKKIRHGFGFRQIPGASRVDGPHQSLV